MFSRPRDILIVEDHADTADVLARVLRSRGHRVQTTGSCAEARRLFELNPSTEVVLIDIGLPDGDGCDLLRDLLAIRHVPGIAVTGYGLTHDIDRSMQAGFIAHITKPLILTALFETLASIKDPALIGGMLTRDGQAPQQSL